MHHIGELLEHTDLPDDLASARIPGALAYRLDLAGPTAPASTEWDPHTVARVGRVGRAMVLAGPEVLRSRTIDALHAFVRAANVGVANTYGAKGLYPWDDPHHYGTVGLQALDFELLGLGGLDLLITVGLDPDEVPPSSYALAPTTDIPPAALPAATAGVAPSSTPLTPPPFFDRIAAVAQPGYRDESLPRHPARAVLELKQGLPSGALVAAQPGLAGLWCGRTFPTDAPGSVIVPPRATPGIAAACALAAARAQIPATVLTIEPVDEITRALADRATREHLPFALVAWGDDVDTSKTRLLVDAAGPVSAWSTSAS